MPLIQGNSPRSIQENIHRLIREGKSPAQASAIAHGIARRVTRERKRRKR